MKCNFCSTPYSGRSAFYASKHYYCDRGCFEQACAEAAAHPNPEPPVPLRPTNGAESGKFGPEAQEEAYLAKRVDKLEVTRKKYNRLRDAVEKYRQAGALQHSPKCTYKECACGLEDIFNALV